MLCPERHYERRVEMDRYKLEYEMKSKGVTVEELCKAIGMSKAAYYRKLKGRTEFTRGEIQKMIDFLNLEDPMDIFFTTNVS